MVRRFKSICDVTIHLRHCIWDENTIEIGVVHVLHSGQLLLLWPQGHQHQGDGLSLRSGSSACCAVIGVAVVGLLLERLGVLWRGQQKRVALSVMAAGKLARDDRCSLVAVKPPRLASSKVVGPRWGHDRDGGLGLFRPLAVVVRV